MEFLDVHPLTKSDDLDSMLPRKGIILKSFFAPLKKQWGLSIGFFGTYRAIGRRLLPLPEISPGFVKKSSPRASVPSSSKTGWLDPISPQKATFLGTEAGLGSDCSDFYREGPG